MRFIPHAAIAVLSCAASFAPAGTIYIRENSSPYNSTAVTTTPFDDAGISVTSGNGSTTNSGTASNISLRTTSAGIVDRELIAIKNLFTLLPGSSGGNAISITSATLHLFANSSFPGDANSTLHAYRVTTNWLTTSAGANESNVSGKYIVPSPSVYWSSTAGFSAADYTTAGGSSITWNGGSNFDNALDVTSIVQGMYSNNANYGFVLDTTSTSTISIRAAEQANATTPVLAVTYTYTPEPVSLGVLAITGMGVLSRRRKAC